MAILIRCTAKLLKEKWAVSYDGGLRECDISKLTKRLNRTPLLTQKFTYSIEEFGRVLGVKVNPKFS